MMANGASPVRQQEQLVGVVVVEGDCRRKRGYVRHREEWECGSYRWIPVDIRKGGGRAVERRFKRIRQIARRICRRNEEENRDATDDHQRPYRPSRRVVINQPNQLPKFLFLRTGFKIV